MRLLAHIPLKRESGGERGSLPGAMSLRLKPPLAVFVSTLLWIVGIGKLSQIKWFPFPVFTYFPSKCSWPIQIREWTEGLKSWSFTNSVHFLLKSGNFSCLGNANPLAPDLQYFKQHLFTFLLSFTGTFFFLNKDWDKRNPAELKGIQLVGRIHNRV